MHGPQQAVYAVQADDRADAQRVYPQGEAGRGDVDAEEPAGTEYLGDIHRLGLLLTPLFQQVLQGVLRGGAAGGEEEEGGIRVLKRTVKKEVL